MSKKTNRKYFKNYYLRFISLLLYILFKNYLLYCFNILIDIIFISCPFVSIFINSSDSDSLSFITSHNFHKKKINK